MAQIDKYNIGRVVEDLMLRDLKDAVTTSITRRLVEEFEKTAKIQVQKEVEKIFIKGVQSHLDLVGMKDEIKLYVEWREDSSNE